MGPFVSDMDFILYADSTVSPAKKYIYLNSASLRELRSDLTE